MGTELEKQSGGVPALANTPATSFTAEDIALPRVRLGQHMSEAVQDGSVKFGDIFATFGSDDPDPTILDQSKDGVLMHVLTVRKGWSLTGDDGKLITFDDGDPDTPPDAWKTFDYAVVLPEADPTVPFKWLFTKTGTPAAKIINMTLARTAAQGPAYQQAFRVSTKEKQNDRGKYVIPIVKHVEADEENIKLAAELAQMISADTQPPQDSSPSEDPAI